ncbi:MAG: hypothetical protein DMG70_27475 [Acidobacteria bacterium]|nr:MAG: hypothetical protein DMG70_27475 [Acidobacteriota bacterium]PYY08369.1 MAG: hypothetical protein DMG69_15365 [Acidobacteriota bacterium]
MRLGHVVLPKGEYKVQHTREGENHVMVFSQLHTSEPATALVKCRLVPLKVKAPATQLLYDHNEANRHVLQELIFCGGYRKARFLSPPSWGTGHGSAITMRPKTS